MQIALIAAMTDERVIGVENRLPWRLPADMRWFRRHTLGKPIIMGRKTFESLGCRPLPERRNIVVTHDRAFRAEGIVIAHSIEEALAEAADCAEAMIIGGASFYAQLLPRADRLYLTWVHAPIRGDAWFPAFDPAQWHEVLREAHPADDKNPHACSFVVLERMRGSPDQT